MPDYCTCDPIQLCAFLQLQIRTPPDLMRFKVFFTFNDFRHLKENVQREMPIQSVRKFILSHTVEFSGIIKYVAHICYLWRIPLVNRLIEMQCQFKHAAHICNIRGIPLSYRLIEFSCTAEHAAHIRNIGGVPVFFKELLKSQRNSGPKL